MGGFVSVFQQRSWVFWGSALFSVGETKAGLRRGAAGFSWGEISRGGGGEAMGRWLVRGEC